MFKPHKANPDLTRSRNCISETGIYQPPKEIVRQLNSNGFTASKVPFLPPLEKTRSLPTNVFQPSGQYQPARPPVEPKKRPPLREMVLMTLRHIDAPVGLTFVQLATVISEVFEFPRTISTDLRLKKTLSNMVSRQWLRQVPGLGPHDSYYQICQNRADQNFNLFVTGKSVPVMQLWPTGNTLPKGCSPPCRPARVERSKESRIPAPRYAADRERRRSYRTTEDPMFQSFGKRAGLNVLPEEHRPNSPTMGIDEEEPPPEIYNNMMNDNNASTDEDCGGGGDRGQTHRIQQPVTKSQKNPYGIKMSRKPAPSVLDTVTCDRSTVGITKKAAARSRNDRSIFGAGDASFSLEISDDQTAGSNGPVDYLAGLASLIDRYDE